MRLELLNVLIEDVVLSAQTNIALEAKLIKKETTLRGIIINI